MAVMYTVIIKNNSGSDKLLTSFGITLVDGTQVTLSDRYSFPKIAGDDSLRNQVGASDLICNNGTSDLSSSEGVKYLTLTNNTTLESYTYSKSHIDGISAGLDPKESVRSATTEALPTCVYDNGTNGVGATLTATINGFLSTMAGVTMVSTNRLLVKDQVDKKQNGIYVVTSVGDTNAKWVLTRAIDFDNNNDNTGLVSGGAHTFVETGNLAGNEYTVILDGTATLGTSLITFTQSGGYQALTALQDEVDNIEEAVGLNDDGTYPTPTGTTYLDSSTTIINALTILDGQIKTDTDKLDLFTFNNGILYTKDTTRSNKFLSPSKVTTFSKKSLTKDQYLECGSDISSMLSGERMIRNACIVGISCDLSSAGSCTIDLRKKGSGTDLGNLTISSATGNQDGTLNIDLNAGDILQVRVTSTSGVTDPMVTVEYAWRYTA